MIVMVITMMLNNQDPSLIDILGLILNPILAIIASIVAWLVSVKMFKPEIGISTEIVTKDKKEAENKMFKFKIQNQSRRREVYDISVYATYCFASKNYYSTRIRHLPVLKINPYVEQEKTTPDDMEPYEMKINILGPQTKGNTQQSLEDFLIIFPAQVIQNHMLISKS